ncbi:MAG: hypothetical protein JNJ43_04405 [Anaerolineales bacterium]|nr:hypothetical protein [Anaerolineales bacterium]
MESLPWDMISVIIGGLGFLLALVLEWNKLEPRQRIIVSSGVGVAVFLLVYFVARPLLTLEPTPTADNGETSTSNTYFFDDFNSGTDFNANYWRRRGDLACSTQLKSGQVEFSLTNNIPSASVCALLTKEDLYEEVGSMEAVIRAQNGATGDYSIGVIEFSKGTFEEGTQTWIIQCGVFQIPNQNSVQVFFNVHSTYPEGTPEFNKAVLAVAERSYSMKLEIIPESDEVVCYADGQMIGSYKGSNLTSLHGEIISRKILGFWSSNSQATYYIDSVNLSPPK